MLGVRGGYDTVGEAGKRVGIYIGNSKQVPFPYRKRASKDFTVTRLTPKNGFQLRVYPLVEIYCTYNRFLKKKK